MIPVTCHSGNKRDRVYTLQVRMQLCNQSTTLSCNLYESRVSSRDYMLQHVYTLLVYVLRYTTALYNRVAHDQRVRIVPTWF